MSEQKPRIRIMDLNELEKLRNDYKTIGNIEALCTVDYIKNHFLSDPQKTKDLLSEVFIEGASAGKNYNHTLEMFKENYLNNLIL